MASRARVHSPTDDRPGIPHKATWSLAVMICGFTLYFAYYVILQHAAFETYGYDLGIMSQAIWNTSRGRFMEMTMHTKPGITSRWAIHFDPVLLLFVPIYGAFPTPVILTVFQVLIVAMGAIPIFWIARNLLRDDWAGVIYAGVYLMLPALQAAVTFDFHGATLVAPFLAFALWALLQRRYIVFGVWSLLAMSCKEEISLLVLMMGLYILLIQRQWKKGGIIIAVSVTWFVIASFVIIPFYSPIQDSIYIARYSSLGSSMEEIILSFFVHPLRVLAVAFEPSKLPYWIRLTMPVAFTSLLDPSILLLSLPSLAINTLSNESFSYRPDFFHYTAPIVPLIVVSSIRGIARLSGWLGRNNERLYMLWRKRLLGVVIGASLVYHMMAGFTPLGALGVRFRWPSYDEHDVLAKQMLYGIPPRASVSAQNSLASHLANRPHVYVFPKNEAAEYIALDMQGSEGSLYPIRYREEFRQKVHQLVADPSYGVVYFADGLLLLQRGVPDAVTISSKTVCNRTKQ